MFDSCRGHHFSMMFPHPLSSAIHCRHPDKDDTTCSRQSQQPICHHSAMQCATQSSPEQEGLHLFLFAFVFTDAISIILGELIRP